MLRGVLEAVMAEVLIRQIDEELERRLQRRAARHGRSVEAEARAILTDAVKEERVTRLGLGSEIAGFFRGLGLDHEISELRGFTVRAATFEERSFSIPTRFQR
jgi:plasmid stability protein